MWRWKSDWGWCLGGAYFLAKFQAGGAYSGGAYKKKRVLLYLKNVMYFSNTFASDRRGEWSSLVQMTG